MAKAQKPKSGEGKGKKVAVKDEEVNGKRVVVKKEDMTEEKIKKVVIKEEENELEMVAAGMGPAKGAVKREGDENKAAMLANEEGGGNDGEAEWWTQGTLTTTKKGEKRWDTLLHNGVLFPPAYVPHGIPILYNQQKFEMTPEEEEVATMFAVLREHDYYRNEVFRRNFFQSWREILDKRKHPIRCLELCDFSAIYEWHQREVEKRKSRTREEKKELKRIADEEAEPYKWCIWNGKKEQVANFRVEPPGLFRGRGEHPMRGKLKKRILPEDVVLNIGKEAPIPQAPAGHKWKGVVHDQNVTWLAMWYEPTIGQCKYVMLAPSSTLKGQSDYAKFETARELKNHIDDIRESYTKDFSSTDEMERQRAVATYFIDKLALRVGHEKGEEEADTVGCCSLRKEHIELRPDNVVRFDFLGKDSIRYVNEVTVLPEVYKLLGSFIKRTDSEIFRKVTPTTLNNYLKSFLKDLSAKVFRTYNASITLDEWFREKPVDPKASLSDKLVYFNKANTEVAKLCNHQRSIPKTFHVSVQSIKYKLEDIKRTIDTLRRAQSVSENGSVEEAATQFFKEQDEVQYQWLNTYGTPEEIQAYEEFVKKRVIPSALTGSASSTKNKSGKKTANGKSKKSGGAKRSTKKAGGTKKKKTRSKKSAAKTGKKASGKKKKQKKRGGSKRGSRGKNGAGVASGDENDEDAPLVNIIAK
ncbi:DNA topoisomerase IB, large subunit, putative [Trypanosoma brucei gambiense DAL972]|uniref:DNA topoisomerase I n=2 Tax=Trypanosoma brucei TaxID=5691 RepID=C9ZLY6_TRYB9|nr:DNA topoisomerase IB, large subunit, putative [Trypanosoma brucei gambiense DAL972]AAP78904.1 type IB DNA topoisomerase large subunit [Trypanosoma brucei]CBH10411.1 DNA topoisomerase IB, large subunit, putative [Trypanosoma brucei gambiense DAL972]|eukprot:XP_011772701.1 DNA topoisomerase IB, large subunit, putative [Trypanosoma brucei gambiense DAL972]